MKKNPYYYDADKVKLEEITVRVIDDATAAVCNIYDPVNVEKYRKEGKRPEEEVFQ